MGGLFHKPKTPSVAPAPEVPEGPTEAEKQAALEREKKQQRMARGRRSTILTGGLGLTTEAPVARKTLLGQ